MKKSTFYLILAVIWALGTLAWTANGIRCYDEVGTLNVFHIVAAVCSAACAVLNLFIYFQMCKKEK